MSKAKFLQYSIGEILKFIKPFIWEIDVETTYNKKEIVEIYNLIKANESEKTQGNYLLQIIKTLFYTEPKDKYIPNHYLKFVKNNSDDKFITEIIHSTFYDSYLVYETECRYL